MFKSLVRELFPSFVSPESTPDYFAFERSRPAEAQEEALLQALKANAAQDSASVTFNPLPFYDYLFGDTEQQTAQDQLSEYVADKLRQVIQNPDSILKVLPVMPASVTTAMQVLQQQDFDLSALLKIIEKEPSMAADLVKLANSSQYKRGDKEVTDLQRAFMFMGAKGLVAGVIEVYLKQYSVSSNVYFKQFGRKIWQHSDSTAHIAQTLALGTQFENDKNTIYFVGLIRNLGAMVIFQLMVDAFKYVDPDATPSSAHFKQLMANESIHLVTRIAQHWLLPASIVQLLQQQDDPVVSELNGPALCVYEGNLISEAYALLTSNRWNKEQYQQWANDKLQTDAAKRYAASLLSQDADPSKL